ncbi:hypothetical protein IOC57_13035 [Bacillus sp. SD075]|uniref:hypothetical protein n=1 Tax=Bacillus sp. SD075 TaxID=2781732 RepID=UPI001A977E97|nr:hypothetical protein [Bacillus sp. SD075]MBO0998663.1 hypothetical protein [Bacillus sp. SD075]
MAYAGSKVTPFMIKDLTPLLAVAKFPDAKEKHGLLWTAIGRKILSMQATLIFAAMNVKKIFNWTGKGQ